MKTHKIVILLFATFFLVSFLASGPVKIKRFAVALECSTGFDKTLELAINADPAAELARLHVVSQLTMPKINFIADRIFVSGSIYRGPPTLSL
jgi:hypothetical protein